VVEWQGYARVGKRRVHVGHTQTHTYVHTRTHAHIQTHTHNYLLTHSHTQAHTHTRTHTHTHAHTHNTHNAHTHTHTLTHTHTHTHTHTQHTHNTHNTSTQTYIHILTLVNPGSQTKCCTWTLRRTSARYKVLFMSVLPFHVLACFCDLRACLGIQAGVHAFVRPSFIWQSLRDTEVHGAWCLS